MSANKASASTTRSDSNAYRYYVLILLTAVYTFNFIDRQIIGILSPAIKADLGLTDWQLGILKGFAFAVLYTTLGIPIARLADRYSRTTIISVSLAVWSGFTAISGLCNNFAQLAAARVGVGIGEAGGSPPAHSLISDIFPMEKRASALAFYSTGIPIGVALAYLGGGWLTETFSWRVAFVVVGLPGVLLAILLKMTIREPKRGGLEGEQANDAFADVGERLSPMKQLAAEAGVVWKTAKHLLSIPTYRYTAIGGTAISFAAYAAGTWIIDFYARSHSAMPLLQVLFWMGLISASAYVLGTYLGGRLVDHYSKNDKSMYGKIPAIALLLHVPLFLISIWHPSPEISLLMQFPVQLTLGMYLGPMFALAQTLAPISVRALSTAILLFILNLLALGFGPTTAGILSSIWTPEYGEEISLRLALTVTSGLGLISVWAFWMVGRHIDKDWAVATGDGNGA